NVSASTQRQALHSILFLYQATLGIEIGWVDNIVRAKQPQRLPTVMSVDETAAVLAATTGTPGLFLRLLYGTGLRLMEGLRLRVK
ncbi:integron integrase, partial [Erwinia amylovora]|nr:integron integrase [Erwinia amylovora]